MNKLSTYPQPSHVKQTAVLIVIFATVAALSGFAIGRHPIKEANRQLASASRQLSATTDTLEKVASERDGWRQVALDLETDKSLMAEELEQSVREIKALRSQNASLAAELSRVLAPKPKPRIRPTSYTGSIPTLIRSVARSRGLSAADTTALLELARRESTMGANREAYRRGRECVGLFQLDSSKGTYEQRCDDRWSTNAAITYCQRRYGSVSAALRAHDRKGWY